MASGSDDPPLVAIAGETASGKSELAVRLAEKFNGEIIAADSWTVYREFDIGTAKPDAALRARVPHHMLDIVDPRAGFSAAEYKRRVIDIISDIVARKRLPIIVGGTGLYIDSVLFDYSFLPSASPERRATLNALTIEGLLAIIDEAGFDLSGIDIRNKRRLIRLIETNGARPGKSDQLRQNTLILGMYVSREELRARISARVDAMFLEGLENEVATLAKKYGWDIEPMKGIGYREFREYFNGVQSLDEVHARIISSSLNLAKRQRTWFKRNKSIHWISKQDDAVDLMTTFLNK